MVRPKKDDPILDQQRAQDLRLKKARATKIEWETDKSQSDYIHRDVYRAEVIRMAKSFQGKIYSIVTLSKEFAGEDDPFVIQEKIQEKLDEAFNELTIDGPIDE